MMMRLRLQLLAQHELLAVLMPALGGLPSTHFSVNQRPNALLASILKRVGRNAQQLALDEVKAALKHIRMVFSWLNTDWNDIVERAPASDGPNPEPHLIDVSGQDILP